MKLSKQYNRLNVATIIITFVAGSCIFYFLLSYVLLHQVDETLQTERQEIIAYTQLHHALPEIISTKDQHTDCHEVGIVMPTTFLTTRDGASNELLRTVRFTATIPGKTYFIAVSRPLEETEALQQIIIVITLIITGIILLAGYLINRIVLSKLWRPFYNTIDSVNSYSITGQQPLITEQVSTDEFRILNSSINKMTERIKQDYEALKNLNGQAAHEIQTPLAIIKARLDNLMQDEAVLRDNARHITDIENAVSRLSRLHQSLLLLTKVEHKQFSLQQAVNMEEIVAEKWADYAERADTAHIDISVTMQPMTLTFHRHLAEIIVNNLLSNAIKYNIPGGKLSIVLDKHTLTIANTSANSELEQAKLFRRFYKDNKHDDSNGLGLSIVKEICDMAGYMITYRFEKSIHHFSILFK